MINNIPLATDQMKEQAKRNPGGWVYKIDWPYQDNEYVPPEAIEGAFKVDSSGLLTNFFEENKRYRPIRIASREPREYMERIIAPHLYGKWTVEVDPAYDDLFPEIPDEGQIGQWYLGVDGKYTGEFRHNSLYSGSIVT